jgi:spermidine synthase
MGLRLRGIYLLLFALSGFSGLIYESIWTDYLKLFLGHAAYAQTLVLAIFMGGMAIGSAISSRYSLRWKNLLLCYAATEGLIGLCALPFHTAFDWTIDYSYTTIIPHLNNPAVVNAFKWTISALMILPQSVLLGMTFPLMSAGILRLFPEKPGSTIAMLYFTNSIGAAAGVLVSGFVLIRLVGLPGTMGIAGFINIILAVTVWSLLKKSETPGKTVDSTVIDAAQGSGRKRTKAKTKTPPAGQGYSSNEQTPELQIAVEKSSPEAGPIHARPSWYRFFLLASLVTGAASFIYEIGWIRMLSLVLGSSTHSFELMLSAFLLGLALGGLWIHWRIERVASPVRYLAHVQVCMGLLALLTLPLYGNTFSIMQWLVKTLSKTDTGYALFNLSSSAIAMTFMMPTTFCAGMTLPLITFIMLREGHGERSIGAVYAANTIGAIIGVFFAIHLGMPLLGLKGLITCGAALDIALGLLLFWSAAAEYRSWRVPAVVTAVCVGALAGTVGLVELDLFKMGSGVYRFGILLPRRGFRHLYHLDGKTATVDVFLDGMGTMRINTNGKTDATIMMDPERSAGMDESTMTLLAAIPMSLHPHATSAASIGLGSGLTAQILLTNPLIRRVDTVEIEKGMVEAARNFRPNVELVYTDPRSRIHVDDAKTFFSTHNGKYDLIISEPSNPWVSGVSGLFSEEFYRLVKRSMNADGLFVQWVQLYEIDTELVISVLKAVAANFSDFAVYAPDDTDIMIIARKSGLVPEPDPNLLKNPAIAAALKRIRIEGAQDIELRKLGTGKSLRKLIASFPVRANSDYYPVLDQNAGRTRFLGANAQELLYFGQAPLPVTELLSGGGRSRERTEITATASFWKSEEAATAMALRDYFIAGKTLQNIAPNDQQQAVRLKKLFHDCNSLPDQNGQLESLFTTADNIIPYLTPAELERIWQALESGACAASLPALDKKCVVLLKAVSRRDAPGMVAAAQALLEGRNFSATTLKYIASSGMLGYLMQGKKEESYVLWSQYKTAMFGYLEPNLLFRLLVAESKPL